MKIKHVLEKTSNNIMDVQEVALHPKHSQIKNELQCASIDCTARISFVSGGEGKKDHFRTVRYSVHSPACTIQKSKEELEEKRKIAGEIAVSLDEKETKRRVMYLYHKLNSEPKEKQTSGKGTTKRSGNGSKEVPTVTAVIDGNAPKTLSEAKEEGTVPGLRLQHRTLNQISKADEGKYFQLCAAVRKVRKTKTRFELDLYLGDLQAVMVITEAFIKGSKDQQIKDYFDSLMKFTDIEKESKFEISVYAFGMFNEFKENNTVFFADSFNQFYVSVKGKYSLPIKLDSFQAAYVRGIWTK